MMHRARAIVVCMSLMALPTAGFGQTGAPALPTIARSGGPDSRAAGALVQPGDVFRITVWRNAELSGDVAVGEDGTLQHPVYRAVVAAGVSRRELEVRIREVLLRYETAPQYVIEPLVRVSVLGEVRTPNVYSVQATTTVAQAVAMAGGTTERARSRAVLMRDGQRVAVDLREPNSGAAMLAVRSRDQIVVERAGRAVLGSTLGVVSASIAAAASLLIALRAAR